MYLADTDIQALIPELQIETQVPGYPFDPGEQVQPCSIDLRLDSVFWEQRRPTTIDLRKAQLLELSPRRHWRRKDIRTHESLILRPGEMILGRSYEKFSVPKTCAGKIEGRSSFARLGLTIHCSGDFINPGWRGHMPLQLVNHSIHTIRLFPYIPICQLLLVRTSSAPQRLYGEQALQSKYMDDDGGPSYWWRDKRIRQLQTGFGEHDLALRVQEELLNRLVAWDPELLERFERYLQNVPTSALTNADDLLLRFAGAEDRQYFWRRLIRALAVGGGPTLLAVSLGSLYSQPFGSTTYGPLHFGLWALTAAAIALSAIAYRYEPGEYFTSQRLTASYRQKAQP